MNKFKFLATMLICGVVATTAAGCKNKNESDDADFISIEQVIANAKAITAGSAASQDYTVTGTPNFEVPTGGYDGSEVTISFYHTMGSNLKTVLDKYIEKFNVLYPHITVNTTQVGGYDDVRTTITTQLTAGTEPNLAYCYPDHVALYNIPKKVVHLDNLINDTNVGMTQAQIDDFIPGYWNEGRQFGDGLMYTLPFSKSTEVLYYNKTFFTANNISVPDHWFSESVDDTTSMEYVCAKIKTIDPTSIPLGYDSAANWFITMAEQCGVPYTSAKEDHYQFNNETLKAVMKRFREWRQQDWMTTQTLYGSYTSGLFVETGADKSKSYMSIGSSAGATHQRPAKVTVEDDEGNETSVYPFDVGIVEIPQMSSTNKKVISQGPSVCIFKKSNPQEVVASWLLLKYLTTSVEFQAEFALASGYVPVIQSVEQNATYASELAAADGGAHIAALAAKVCLEQKQHYYTSPAFNGSSTAREQAEALLNKCVSKETSTVNKMINEAFQDAIDECEYA